jgi:hypothetical protein
LILRILFYIEMVFLREEAEGSGPVLAKGYMIYFVQDFGKGGVIIIRISIINVYPHIL